MAVRCVKHELTQVARGIGVAKSAAWLCIPRPAKSVKLNPVVILPPDSSSVFEHSVQHDATNNPVLIYVFDCLVLFAAHVTAHADSFKESLKPVIPSLMHRLSSIQPLIPEDGSCCRPPLGESLDSMTLGIVVSPLIDAAGVNASSSSIIARAHLLAGIVKSD